MLPINKLPEPQGLIDYKNNPERLLVSPYDDFCYNRTRFLQLRAQLLQEQKYVCAYCGQELCETLNKYGVPQMKTEHFEPQDETIDNDLNYQNLLGCCLGGQKSKGENYCDSSKGNNKLESILNPSKITLRDNTIRYALNERSEEVSILSSDDKKHNDLVLKNRLNLNHQYLRKERFQIWKNVIKRQLGEQDTWTITTVQQVRNDYSDVSNGHHKAFKDFVLWYIDNWLSKNGHDVPVLEQEKKK